MDSQLSMPALSVVVPCFNEEANLSELRRRIVGSCEPEVGDDFELVLIDDGSTDRTWTLMEQTCAADRRVVAIRFARNFGHEAAMTAGLTLCRGRRVFILDADLQDPPELLGEMMRLMDDGADVVYGRRRRRDGETAFKKLSAKLFYRLLARLADVEIPADTGNFRLINRRALDVLNAMPERFRFTRGMVSWIGFRQVPLFYDRAPRSGGATKYTLRKMIRYAIDAMTSFSVMPLRLASYLGVTMSILSIVLILYVIGSWFAGAAVAGWTSLMSIVLGIGGVELLVLGVIGEYLGRLYMEGKQRPLFVIDTVCQQPLVHAAAAGNETRAA